MQGRSGSPERPSFLGASGTLYKVGDHLTFFGGLGVEPAKEQNLTMTRLGAEYGWHLTQNWEVGIDVLWDGRWGTIGGRWLVRGIRQQRRCKQRIRNKTNK